MEIVYRVEYPELPANLKGKRAERRWSQQELAITAGLSIGVVRKVEQGLQSVELETIVRLCDALEARLEQILGEPAKTALVPLNSSTRLSLLPEAQEYPQIELPLEMPTGSNGDLWDAIIETYNQQKPSLWAKCRELSEKRQRSLRPLLKQFGKGGLLERLEHSLKWATGDEWWSGKDMDFDILLRENRLISWSERWESRLSHSDGTAPLSFGQWFDRAKTQGLVIGSLRQDEEQWVILSDGTQRPYEAMQREYPLLT